MDEVDGCSGGNSDKGGIAALIRIIKTTHNPIVCIANDATSKKITTLMQNCYHLKVQRPVTGDIFKRVEVIATTEKIRIERRALEKIIESANNDIR
jgi:replication factor C large subunit